MKLGLGLPHRKSNRVATPGRQTCHTGLETRFRFRGHKGFCCNNSTLPQAIPKECVVCSSKTLRPKLSWIWCGKASCWQLWHSWFCRSFRSPLLANKILEGREEAGERPCLLQSVCTSFAVSGENQFLRVFLTISCH